MVSWQECELDGLHLTECDADGYCNFCGEQESSEWHQDCPEDCSHCQQELATSQAAVEADHQKKLWGQGGIFWNPDDELCQEI